MKAAKQVLHQPIHTGVAELLHLTGQILGAIVGTVRAQAVVYLTQPLPICPVLQCLAVMAGQLLAQVTALLVQHLAVEAVPHRRALHQAQERVVSYESGEHCK